MLSCSPVAALPAFAGKFAPELAAEAGRVPSGQGAEGYRIRTRQADGAPAVLVIGNDTRGVLFGVGVMKPPKP